MTDIFPEASRDQERAHAHSRYLGTASSRHRFFLFLSYLSAATDHNISNINNSIITTHTHTITITTTTKLSAPAIDDPDVPANLDVFLQLLGLQLHHFIRQLFHEGLDVHDGVRSRLARLQRRFTCTTAPHVTCMGRKPYNTQNSL